MIRLNIGFTFVAALVAAPFLLGAVPAAAQKPVTVSEAITETFTIEAIDHASRVVTLKHKDGFLEDVVCGPEVQRFDALKVGDRVTFRYYESLVSAIRRPGSPTPPAASGGITRTPGGRPGATVSEQMITTVTIQAIDTKAPSVRVTLEDGRDMSFRVENARNLEGYKVGDKVEITYTRALAIGVTPAGK
jgi:Cu/Ag efflux protein CusF